MTRRDEAELNELLTPYFRKKRGMIPKGYRPVVWVGVEQIEPLPTIAVRLVESANSTKTTRRKAPTKRTRKLREDIQALPLVELNLHTKVYRLLVGDKKKNIRTIGDLYTWVSQKEEELLAIPRFKQGSLTQCREKLKAAGFELR